MSDREEKNQTRLKDRAHAVLFYKEGSRQRDAALPFIIRGLKQKEKCVYVASENTPRQIISSLRLLFPMTEKALSTGQLTVLSFKDTYLKNNCFDPDFMFDSIRQLCLSSEKEGYRGSRGTGEMNWIFKRMEYLGSLRDYEIALNSNFKYFPGLKLLCQYGLGRYSAEFLKEMVMSHPFVIYGDSGRGICPPF